MAIEEIKSIAQKQTKWRNPSQVDHVLGYECHQGHSQTFDMSSTVSSQHQTERSLKPLVPLLEQNCVRFLQEIGVALFLTSTWLQYGAECGVASDTFCNDCCYHNSWRQLRQTLLDRTVDNILSRGSNLNCGQAYRGCFMVLQSEQLGMSDGEVFAVREVADLGKCFRI